MKKFLSMLLVFCMIFTTLMGTMVVDVNAAVTKGIMSYTIEEGTADDYSDRNVIVDMPQKATSASAVTAMLYGNWRIRTPYYDATKTDAENEGYYIDIGSFKKYDALGVEFVHMDNPTEQSIELNGDTVFTYSKNIRYHFSPTVTPESRKLTEAELETGNFGTQGIQSLTEAEVNANISVNKKVAHISFYAFSKRGEGTVDLSFYRDSASASGITASTISGADIKSVNGIPRKFDIFLYADCDDSDLFDGTTYTNAKIYVDGKYYKATRGKVNAKATILSMVLQEQMYVHKEGTNIISITSPVNDLYVGYKDTEFEYITRDEASDLTFGEINFTTYNNAGTVNENLVTGVTEDIDEQLEAALLNTPEVDKVINLYQSIYDNPALIYDGDNSTESNVKLIDKLTGDVYAEGNIPEGKTMDDFYLYVNDCACVLAIPVPDPTFVKEGDEIKYTITSTDLKGFDVGNWTLSNGTKEVKLGSTADDVNIMGKIFKKIKLDGNSIDGLPEDAGSITLRPEVYDGVTNALYLSKDEKYTQAEATGIQHSTINEMNEKLAYKGTTEEGVAVYGDVAKFTTYMYSAKQTGEDITVNLSIQNKTAKVKTTISAADIYSADGTPHKVEFVVSTQGTNANPLTAGSYMRIRTYVDGLFLNAVSVYCDKLTLDGDDFVYISPNVSLVPSAGTLSWEDTEYYIWMPPAGYAEDCVTFPTRAEMEDLVFENGIRWDKTYASDKDTVAVSGVVQSVEAPLNTVLLSKFQNNKIEVYESIYNNPSLLYDDDALTTSNVKIIDMSTDVVYDEGEIPAGYTLENACLFVNGIYVKVVSVPDPEITFDITKKLASVRASALPAATTCQIIVAAYNGDKLEDIKVSPAKTVGTDELTFVATGLATGTKYKVFVFDSLLNANPLIKALEIE